MRSLPAMNSLWHILLLVVCAVGIGGAEGQSFWPLPLAADRQLEQGKLTAAAVGSETPCAPVALSLCIGALAAEEELPMEWEDLDPVLEIPHYEALGWNTENWKTCPCYRGHWFGDNDKEFATVEECLAVAYPSSPETEDSPNKDNKTVCPSSEAKQWDELTAEEVQAATELGFVKEIWDAGHHSTCCAQLKWPEEAYADATDDDKSPDEATLLPDEGVGSVAGGSAAAGGLK